jgi:hypothetical protein
LETKVFDLETKVFDLETKVFDLETKVFDLETKVFDWETKVFDWETKVFDLETIVFDSDTLVSALFSTAFWLPTGATVSFASANTLFRQMYGNFRALLQVMQTKRRHICII